jgi:hypothetical protein
MGRYDIDGQQPRANKSVSAQFQNFAIRKILRICTNDLKSNLHHGPLQITGQTSGLGLAYRYPAQVWRGFLLAPAQYTYHNTDTRKVLSCWKCINSPSIYLDCARFDQSS